MSQESADLDAGTLRQALVDRLLRMGSVRSTEVETSFRAVPRHPFLPGQHVDEVYQDRAIGTKQIDGRTVSSSSQPAIMAVMLEQLQLAPGQRVLEIGAGTGYNAALIAHIVGEMGRVITIDIDEDLVASARAHLAAAGFPGVRVIQADGGFGYPGAAPYDRIILTVGSAHIAPAWREQLASDGRLVLPLALAGMQAAVALVHEADHLVSVAYSPCGFMPLRGAFADPSVFYSIGADQDQPGGLSVTLPPGTGGIDAATLRGWLDGPSQDTSLAITVTASEILDGAAFWLARDGTPFAGVRVAARPAERGLAASFFPCTPDFHATVGLCGERGTALLVPRSSATADNQDAPSYSLAVRCFGEDGGLTGAVIDAVAAWVGAGRPFGAGLCIRAYPPVPPRAPGRHEALVTTPWTQFVLDHQP